MIIQGLNILFNGHDIMCITVYSPTQNPSSQTKSLCLVLCVVHTQISFLDYFHFLTLTSQYRQGSGISFDEPYWHPYFLHLCLCNLKLVPFFSLPNVGWNSM